MKLCNQGWNYLLLATDNGPYQGEGGVSLETKGRLHMYDHGWGETRREKEGGGGAGKQLQWIFFMYDDEIKMVLSSNMKYFHSYCSLLTQ